MIIRQLIALTIMLVILFFLLTINPRQVKK